MAVAGGSCHADLYNALYERATQLEVCVGQDRFVPRPDAPGRSVMTMCTDMVLGLGRAQAATPPNMM